jgi:hypothetical protein
MARGLHLDLGVDAEMKIVEGIRRQVKSSGTIQLQSEQVKAMRRCLHELANIFTGMMIAGGLLEQYLEGGSLAGYATDLNSGCERGSSVVRELRGHLLAASGEAEAPRPDSSPAPH